MQAYELKRLPESCYVSEAICGSQSGDYQRFTTQIAAEILCGTKKTSTKSQL